MSILKGKLKYKYTLLFLALCIVIYGVLFLWVSFSPTSSTSLHFFDFFSNLVKDQPSPKDIAEKNLEMLKKQYFRSNGMIESEKNKTTSESQSYAMLIAVFLGDQETFDRVWGWTKNNLQVRPKDKLFAWVWQNGKVADMNPATDADQDIAYALYLGYKKWGDETYFSEAKEIVRDIWDVETKEIGGVRYVTAGNWAVQDKDGVIINPSYLAPYEYRVFATFDAEHNWMSLVDSSYKVLELCSGVAGLAMDWCKIDNQGNVVKNFRFGGKDGSIYSYDALRAPFRVAMDYILYADARAIEYLKKNKIFTKDWKENGKIFGIYNQQGEHAGKNESLANYGAQLASMSLVEKVIAREIFEKKIAPIDSWENVSFYDMSWLWFGIALYTNNLPNLWEIK